MNVPRGWSVKSLGELAETALGKMLDRGKSRGLTEVPYLRNVNVQWDCVDTSDLRMMEIAEDERERFRVQAGDLLVCEGGEVGRTAIWHGRDEYLAYQKALHRVRSRGDLDLKFLRYLLEHYRNNGTLARYSTGSTIAHLPQQKLRALPVPHPPLNRQKRIIGILEDHLSRLDAGLAGLQLASRRMTSWYRASIDHLIWNGQFPCRSVGELLRSKMRNGHSARASKSGQGIRALTLTAVTRNSFSDEFTKFVNVDKARIQDLWLEPGDIFVQRSNTAELVGTTARYMGPPGWAIFPDLLIRLRANPKLVDPEYLAAAMRSERAHRVLRAQARGLAGSMPKIDQRIISELKIPVPPSDRQREVSAKTNQVEESLGRLLAAHKDGIRRAAVLRRSLLQAAFTGGLAGGTTDHEIIEEMAGV